MFRCLMTVINSAAVDAFLRRECDVRECGAIDMEGVAIELSQDFHASRGTQLYSLPTDAMPAACRTKRFVTTTMMGRGMALAMPNVAFKNETSCFLFAFGTLSSSYMRNKQTLLRLRNPRSGAAIQKPLRPPQSASPLPTPYDSLCYAPGRP